VVSGQSSGVAELDCLADLRVDDHPDPVGEIQHACAHQHASEAIKKVFSHDLSGSLADLDVCCSGYPNEPEFLFRRVLVLFALEQVDEAREALH